MAGELSEEQQSLLGWIGKTELQTDVISLAPATGLAATLDLDVVPKAGDPLPPLWSWIYFLPQARLSMVGPDGHPKRGGFLPPVSLPRRMWAGSQLQFHKALHIGESVSRLSRIDKVSFKEGRSGSLIFVRVVHEVSGESGLAITDAHDIVYRDHPRAGEPAPAPQAAPDDAQWTHEIVPDPVLLFRYSALTFNGHRIHYDRPYVTEVEGYAGLVVHGPLIATLLLERLRQRYPTANITHYEFRGVRPLIDIEPFEVCGRIEADGMNARLWARNREGALCMEAKARMAMPVGDL